MLIDFATWEKVDIYSGTIIKVEEFSRAKKPAYKVWVDFGDKIGVKKTSAQITANYSPAKLAGKTVLGVVNLPPKNIAGFISEFLLLGVADYQANISLITVDQKVPNGQKAC
ncbi:MAG: tRNA-binding protein [Candidatus Moeniiplasma glomeromycotorum]|nr:tRNA-binding protein [Candidatus Moeniiplasma glomeromycotorum]MCE8167104.1 tRNA-binding protein [Candidatus Moeniiplasma glomeromycotorum]MCE8168884.1 tRNA-binding protein [Candidatus Moeniiplasma glomeromycotorum]